MSMDSILNRSGSLSSIDSADDTIKTGKPEQYNISKFIASLRVNADSDLFGLECKFLLIIIIIIIILFI